MQLPSLYVKAALKKAPATQLRRQNGLYYDPEN